MGRVQLEGFTAIGGILLTGVGGYLILQFGVGIDGHNRSWLLDQFPAALASLGWYILVLGLGWLGAWSQLQANPGLARLIFKGVGFLGLVFWIVLGVVCVVGLFNPREAFFSWVAGWAVYDFIILFTVAGPFFLLHIILSFFMASWSSLKE